MKKFHKIEPWKIESSKYLIKDRWITVRADDCITKEGIRIAPYYVLEYPDWVHMVVVDSKHRILVTRQYRHGVRRVISELPCGTFETKDKNPLVAAKRELMEETGYSGTFVLIGVTYPNPANHDNKIYTYLVTDPIQKNIPKHNPLEVLQYKFLDMQQVFKLIDKKEFTQALHISDIFLSLREIKNQNSK